MSPDTPPSVLLPAMLLVALIVEVVAFVCVVYFGAATTTTAALSSSPPGSSDADARLSTTAAKAARFEVARSPPSTRAIPLLFFQTWHSTPTPPLMTAAMSSVRARHPLFAFFLFDTAQCRAFIQTHFGAEVTRAFDALKPAAYKADLWRYCVLHRLGGVYVDVKYAPTSPAGDSFLDDIAGAGATSAGHLVADVDARNIYNAVMVCAPGNDLMRRCVLKVVENVNARFYGDDSLHVTGPAMIREVITAEERKRIVTMRHYAPRLLKNQKFVSRGKTVLFEMYRGYYTELKRTGNSYSEMWRARDVYVRLGTTTSSGAESSSV